MILNPGNWFFCLHDYTISGTWGGKEVMWAFTVMSTFFPLYYHLFNIAEIADDTSASWPVSVIVSVFSSVHCKNLGPLGLRSPCLSLSCCPCRPHSPLDSGIRPQPLLSPPLPSTLPSPTDPLAESVGAICGGEATFSLPGCYFSLHWFFLLLKYKHKARAYLRNTCLPHWFSLLLLHKSCLHNIAHGSWQHTLTGRVNCKI